MYNDIIAHLLSLTYNYYIKPPPQKQVERKKVMRNKKIRKIIKELDFKYWQVAEKIGISRCTFSEWLRYELTGERLERVQKALDELRADKEAGETV